MRFTRNASFALGSQKIKEHRSFEQGKLRKFLTKKKFRLWRQKFDNNY